MMLVQLGRAPLVSAAGMLTLGYAIAFVAFTELEKASSEVWRAEAHDLGQLNRRLSIAVLMPTNVLLGQYKGLG